MEGPQRGGIVPIGLPIAPRLNGFARLARSQDFGLSVACHVEEGLVLSLHVGRDLVRLPKTCAGVLWILVPDASSGGDGIAPAVRWVRCLGPHIGRRDLN